MNALTTALADVCRERMLAEKWVIAPSLRVGHQWLEAVARGGQAVVNARVKTLTHVALDLAGPAMAREGLSLLGTVGGQVVMGRVWARLRQEREGGYLLGLEASPGLFQTLLTAVQDIRLAGLDANGLSPRGFEVGAKGEELAAILRAYLDELRAAGRVDRAQVLRLAAERLRAEPAAVGPNVAVLLPDDAEMTAMVRALLDALPAGRLVSLPVDEPLSPRLEQTDLALLRWLPEPADAPEPVGDGTARIVRAVGEANEVRGALRGALAAGVPLDEIELLHTDAETYVPLVYELALRLRTDGGARAEGVPVTFAEGIPASYSRPGRALRAWLAWRRDGYPQAPLVRMLQDGLLEAAGPGADEARFHRLANALRPIPIGFGRDRYLGAIDAQIASLKQQLRGAARGEDQDEEPPSRRQRDWGRRLEDVQELRGLVAGLLEHTPPAEAPQREMLQDATAFLREHARCGNQEDAFARKKLIEEIEKLPPWLEGGEGLVGLDVAQWLDAMLGSAEVLGSGPRPGRLHVANVFTGGHSGRPYTIIVGLDDSRFPGAGTQDPVLLDGERQRVSADLPTAAGRLREKLDRFARLLARLRGTVTLSYSCRSLEDDREMFASPVVLAAHRILSGEREADPARLAEQLAPPASFAPAAPERCLDDADWWLWRLCGPATVADRQAIVQVHFPRLHRGLATAEQRTEAALSACGGYVPEAGAEHDPASPRGPVVSASRLETLGACPLRYFFRYILGLARPDETAIDESRWLDPPTFGSLLHEVFCTFIRELRRDDRLPELARDRERLHEILDAHVEKYLAACPPPSRLVFLRQRRELERTAETFLAEEEAFCQTSQPLFCEAAIGLPSDADGTPIDTPEPVPLALPNGTTIRVRGRIDRIDRVGEACQAAFAVWDYKTGGTSRFQRGDPFRQGRVVQNVLSLRLSEAQLKAALSSDARVERFGYFFPGVRAHGERIAWTPEELAGGGNVLARLCAIAAGGCFLPTNDATDCTYCDYAAICGDVEALAAASEAVLGDLGIEAVEPFRELRSHG